MQFTLTASVVLMMLAYAIPGFLFVKTKMIKPDQIKAFSRVLLYLCSSCLTLYSFQKIQYSKEMALNMLGFLLFAFAIQLIALGIMYLAFRKKYDDAKFRVASIGAVFGNVGFMGVPLLETLLPNNPEAVTYSAIYIISMNILSWTLGCYILTRDKQHASIRKVFINPTSLMLLLAVPLFLTSTQLPEKILTPVTLVGKMSTPICMLILGMRFATVKPKELFFDWTIYLTSFLKLIIFPGLGFLLMHFLPVAYSLKASMFILCCCPTASVVLNFSEIHKIGEKNAANIVLASTLFSMITIPLLLLIL